MKELQVTVKLSIKFYYDNKTTISISLNPHDKTKQVEVDRHFIKKKVKDDTIYIIYAPKKEQ